MSVNGKSTRVSHAFVKKNMVRYIRSHDRFAHCSCEHVSLTLMRVRAAFSHSQYAKRRFGLLYRNIVKSYSLIVLLSDLK